MKKVKFKNPGRAMYALLCAGLLAVGIASVAGYKAAVNSVTDGLITQRDEADIPDVDYSAVDAVLNDVEKAKEGSASNVPSAPETEENVLQPQIDVNSELNGPLNEPEKAPEEESPSDGAYADLAEGLEALYYEQAVMMPVNGEILCAYSEGELIKTSGGVWRTHDGIDIGAAEGTKVKSMTSGVVTDVYNDALWGCCVTVDHGNALCGCYYGLSPDLEVKSGDRLNSGDVIGTVGNTADIESDSGPHLHFALKYENRWIDPISYIEPMK